MIIPHHISEYRQLYITLMRLLEQAGSRGMSIGELRDGLNMKQLEYLLGHMLLNCRSLALINAYGETKATRYVITSRGRQLARDLDKATARAQEVESIP